MLANFEEVVKLHNNDKDTLSVWKEFVKDDEDYCNKCSSHNEYCYCDEKVIKTEDKKRIDENLKNIEDKYNKGLIDEFLYNRLKKQVEELN